MKFMLAGEKKAWKKLSQLGADEVTGRAGVDYHGERGGYILPVFGQPFLADSREQAVTGMGNGHHHFHTDELTHFGLLVPLYLVSCSSENPTGRLVSPQALEHGNTFFRGRHELPTEIMAHHFGSHPDRFMKVGCKLGGVPAGHGDAAVAVPVFPRLPVTLILWVGDLEFPPRVQMLLDETATLHFPLDALWATLIMTSQAFIQVAGPHH